MGPESTLGGPFSSRPNLACPTLIHAASTAVGLARDGHRQSHVRAIWNQAIERFLHGEWATIHPARIAQFTGFDASVRADVFATMTTMIRELEGCQPTVSVLPADHAPWRQRLEDATVRLATHTAALALSGIPSHVEQEVVSAATDLIDAAHFAGLVAERRRLLPTGGASQQILSPFSTVSAPPPANVEVLTGAVFALLLAQPPSGRDESGNTNRMMALVIDPRGDQHNSIESERGILGALRRYDVHRLHTILTESSHRTTNVLDYLNQHAAPGTVQDPLSRLIRPGSVDTADLHPRGPWWEYVAFLTTMSALYRARHPSHARPTRGDALLAVLSHLPQVAQWLQAEGATSAMARDRHTVPTAHVPFPVAARATYLQAAVSHGLPVGYVLQELYDAPDLTFGHAERRYFEQIALASGRAYAHCPSTIEAAVLSPHQCVTIDIALDVRATASDTALVDLARDLIWPTPEHTRPDSSGKRAPRFTHRHRVALEAAVTRSRARQEVRLLTALFGMEGHIPADVIASASDLPHVRRFALHRGPDTAALDAALPNGESLRSMEASTRQRWIQYRRSASGTADVVPLPISLPHDYHLPAPPHQLVPLQINRR